MDTDVKSGLSSNEAATRLKSEGYNELPAAGRRSALIIILGVMREPMFGLLVAAVIVYLMIGELKESIILSFFALLSVSIAIIQEWRSEKVLDALRDLTSPRALVIRDGRPQRIAGREVVRGDLIVLSEGDRVPADARLISKDIIATDESLLTGESVPVSKNAGGENADLVFAGTLVVQGSAKATVTATGDRSEIGKIGQTLKSVETEQPRLRKQIRKVIRFFAVISILFSTFSILLYGFLRHDWLDGVLSGIALGMALLPEEFPLVLTVFMVMGAWRISKARVLTRKAAAIETLGSATVLCTDKTGTLTQNKMSIVFLKSGHHVWQEGESYAPQEIIELLQSGLKASKRDSYDPMDVAFFQHFLSKEADVNHIPEFHYGLQPKLPMMAQVFEDGDQYKIFAKGAPETIARACGFTDPQMEDLHREAETLARQGMRVLGIAQAKTTKHDLPENADAFEYKFMGLAGFADPLRENVPAAVAECRAAGMRVIMITGDYPATAHAIAMQAGLDGGKVVSGAELKEMDNTALKNCVRETNIFARITPDQKLRIVNALKESGEVVAMTGDGVNDAPSLKAAHIGVAMGGRGTDVAREASAIVLLDDNFGSLVNTVALGRRIYDNLQKAMVYITAVHVPIAGLALLPLLFNKPLILTPLLIALMEMVIDPACSIVLEAEEAEKDVMKRPPRNPQAPLLSFAALAWGFTQGSMALLIVGSMWVAGFQSGMPENEIRSLVFVSLMVINLTLILANRSFSPSLLLAFERRNPFLGWGALSVSALFGLFLFWPPAKELFGFGPLHGHDVLYALGSGFFLLIVLELLKPLFQRLMLK
jgi:P-type Ca2+ transporter type 2C